MFARAFYEWRKLAPGKQPIARATRSFAVITTDANATMRPIRDRMPVILEPADWPAWLGEAEGDPASLLRPPAENVLRLWPISTRVNAARNNGLDLLDQLAEESEASGPNPT